jgi:AraC-like DNA-binding protein
MPSFAAVRPGRELRVGRAFLPRHVHAASYAAVVLAGLAPETISRGFGRVFGTTAASFRAEARARRAFEQIVRTNAPLVDIAANSGFADQAHMTRAVRALTGAPANSWRSRSISFKSIAEESRLLAE